MLGISSSYEGLGKLQEALVWAEKAYSLNPHLATSSLSFLLYRLGKRALEKGDFRKAKEYLQKSQQILPSPETQRLLKQAEKSISR
ncbi:MAG: tetratricopeptide repeat protein [Caldiserica bacterium]|nr:tetratricopeptide repeat protein [Caldisericota bacterium]